MFDFNRIFQNHPENYKGPYNKFIGLKNSRWTYYTLHIVMLISTFMFMMAMMIDDVIQIKIANGVFVVLIFIELFISRLSVPEDIEEVMNFHIGFVDTVVMTCLIWGASVAGYTHDSSVAILNLTLVIVFVPTVFNLPWQKVALMYLMTFLYLTFLTPYATVGELFYPPRILSVGFLMIFGWFISRLMYVSVLDNFVVTKALEKQKSRLRETVIKKTHEFKSLEEVRSKEIIVSLSKVLEFYDLYTKGHSENVARLSQKIAREMGLSMESVNILYWCGMVHDIGKIQVRREVLNKDGKLTDDEFDMIKKHPEFGFEMLRESKGLEQVAEIILHHHERWDGKGYPEGKVGHDIPVESLILSVADSWDAMASKRIYRDALSYDEAIGELKRCSGTQFAPKVVEAFLRILDDEHLLYE